MKKTFDAVAFMRARRAEIDKEDEGLSWKERCEKTRRIVENDPLYQRLKHRVIQPRTIRYMAIHETPEQNYGGSKD